MGKSISPKPKLWVRNEKAQLLLYLVVFGMIGGLVVLFSHAATSSSSIEPEGGTTNGAVARFSDANSSGGQAVKFGTAASGGIGLDTTCIFKTISQPTTVTFCDGFNVGPQGQGTQTGDLNPTLWGVSRIGDVNLGQGALDGLTSSHNFCAGGGTTGDPVNGDINSTVFGTATPAPADVRICNGQMAESQNDGHGVVNIDTYPKQPFDFANRTGTVVFDLGMNSDGTHGAWPEFIITDEPVPGVRFSVSSGVPAHAVNEVGITFDGCGGSCVGRVYLSKNYDYTLAAGSADLGTDKIDATAVLVQDGQVQQVDKRAQPGAALNHIEVRISQNSLEVWASDSGGANFKKIAHVNNLGLTFTKGLVWMSDTHYNARKALACQCGTQYDHTFLWDNLGFDGPKTYRDLAYDVPYSHTAGPNDGGGVPETNVGYYLGATTKSFSLPGVVWSQTPTKAKVVFNIYSYDDNYTVSASLNGHAAVSSRTIPTGFGWFTTAIDLPAGDAVQGTNTLTLSSASTSAVIANISLIMVAGAPVP